MEALIEGYAELAGYRSKAYIGIRLMDIERALKWCSPTTVNALFFVGMLGLTLREAADETQTSKDTAHRRYRRGIQELTRKLNGGRSG